MEIIPWTSVQMRFVPRSILVILVTRCCAYASKNGIRVASFHMIQSISLLSFAGFSKIAFSLWFLLPLFSFRYFVSEIRHRAMDTSNQEFLARPRSLTSRWFDLVDSIALIPSTYVTLFDRRPVAFRLIIERKFAGLSTSSLCPYRGQRNF